MTRLIVVVEGQTERDFVNSVLRPHLDALGVYTSASIVGKTIAQRRGHTVRGGGHFANWHQDIARLLAGQRSADLRVTTLFDLYGLPNDFPGLSDHGADTDTNRRCDDLQAALGKVVDDHRFIPYIQRHEFEALVLAALPQLEEWLDAEDDLEGIRALRSEIGETPPEDVNDGKKTAPSKRLEALIPGFSKVAHGVSAVEDAGLPLLRGKCPRFGRWLTQLEALAGHFDRNPG